MKTRILLCSLLLTVSNLFGQSTLQRVIPTTSEFMRKFLTNESPTTAAIAIGAQSPTNGVPANVVSNIVDGEISKASAGYTPIVYTQPSAYYPSSNPNGYGPGIQPRGGVTGPNSFAPMVIWDDDFPVDVDDVMALGLGMAYMDDGLINIVALTSSTDRTNDPVSVPMTEAIANYYGYPGIMQGAPINTYPMGNPPLRPPLSFAADNQMWLGAAQFYPHTIPASSNAPIALDVWRRVLASSPSNSVKLFMAGSLRNLYNLWNSGPDQWSALTGPQLIARSVSEIIQVNGVWPANTNLNDVNFNLDPQAAWVSTNNFQVPVTYLGVPTALGAHIIGGSTITNRSVGDIIRVLHDTFQTNVNAIYPLNAAGDVPDWCGPAIMWMAFGTTLNGVPIFSTVSGHPALASYGYSFSNYWTTAQMDQRYLVWQQNSNFYGEFDEALLGRVPRGRRADVLATKPNSTPNLVQSIPLNPSDPGMITVSNGFVTAAASWNPLALPNLTFWHDASQSTNAGGTKVTFLPDYGPSQTPGTNASVYSPTLLTNGLNGMPVLSFDAGNSNYLQSLAKNMEKPMTYFAVINATNITGGPWAVLGSIPTVQGMELDIFSGQFRTLRAGVSDVGDSATINANQWYILVATYDANNVLQYYLNGSPAGRSTNNLSFGGFGGGMLIGATAPNNTIGNYFGGQIAEIGKCAINISSNQVNDLVAYLNRKWNIFSGTGNLGTQYFPTGAHPPTLLVSQGGLLTSEIPWSPLGLSQLAYWYDASQSTNVGGTLVTRAPDYGPLSLDATAGGPGPTLITNAQNGKSAYFFNGTTAYLQSGAKDFEKPMTFFGVFNATNTTGPMGIVGSLPNIQGMEVQVSSGILSTLRSGIGSVGSYSPINANQWYAIAITYDTNSVLSYYINGALAVTVTNVVSFGGLSGGMLIGANAPGASVGEFFSGYIGEIGKTTFAMNASQVSDLFTYLSAKWNTYFNPASSGSQFYGVGQTLPTMLQAQNGLVTANLNWNPLALRQLTFWFDGSQATNSAGSAVTYLPDLGPVGTPATNISVYSPKLKASAINGLSALSFDAGNSNYLNSTAKDYEKPMTLFAVLQATNVSGGPWAIIGSEPTIQGMEWDINAGVQRVLRSGISDIGDSTAISATSNYVLVVTYDTNSCLTYYINGVVSGVTTNNLSFGGFTGGMLLGATAPNSSIGNYFGGLIGEIGKCSVALQTNEVADVSGYLNRKWGIYQAPQAAQFVTTNDSRSVVLQGSFSVLNPTNGTLFFVDLPNNAYGLIQTNGQRLVWTNGIEYQVSATNTFWSQNIRATTSFGVISNSMSLWPTAPAFPGGCAIVNSNGYPYILLSTNGSVGSATWTATNKFGW